MGRPRIDAGLALPAFRHPPHAAYIFPNAAKGVRCSWSGAQGGIRYPHALVLRSADFTRTVAVTIGRAFLLWVVGFLVLTLLLVSLLWAIGPGLAAEWQPQVVVTDRALQAAEPRAPVVITGQSPPVSDDATFLAESRSPQAILQAVRRALERRRG